MGPGLDNIIEFFPLREGDGGVGLQPVVHLRLHTHHRFATGAVTHH